MRQPRISRQGRRERASLNSAAAAAERCGVYFMCQKNKQRHYGKGLKNRPYQG